MSKQQNKNEVQFNMRISLELRERIREDAFKKDVTMSDVVRLILETYYGING